MRNAAIEYSNCALVELPHIKVQVCITHKQSL